jgi:hypothetical protein
MNSSAARVISLALVGLAVILPAEADSTVDERDQATVADRNPMSVAGEVGEHLLRPGERTLGVDHPFAAAQRREVAIEGHWIFEAGEIGEERQLAGVVSGA